MNSLPNTLQHLKQVRFCLANETMKLISSRLIRVDQYRNYNLKQANCSVKWSSAALEYYNHLLGISVRQMQRAYRVKSCTWLKCIRLSYNICSEPSLKQGLWDSDSDSWPAAQLWWLLIPECWFTVGVCMCVRLCVCVCVPVCSRLYACVQTCDRAAELR